MEGEKRHELSRVEKKEKRRKKRQISIEILFFFSISFLFLSKEALFQSLKEACFSKVAEAEGAAETLAKQRKGVGEIEADGERLSEAHGEPGTLGGGESSAPTGSEGA